ncbi:MAG: hypothetical protein E4G89_03995 [Methanothrix sp.]|nr:MAG: hypothetical protein E4G89_03995 [Methanothrix sp.]
MKKLLSKIGVLGAAGMLLLLAGCFIVSGTFTIEKSFSFPVQAGLYHYLADVTDEQDWIDHKDDIDNIDGVGYDIWFTNYGADDVTFNIWVDGADEPEYLTFAQVNDSTTKILDNLTLPPGQTHLTYGNSFGYIQNVETIRTLGMTGKFHMYGASKTGTGGPFAVDSGKVIFTFTGHK